MTAGQPAASRSTGQAAATGHDTAVFVITGQVQAGMPTGAIERHHHDMTAWLRANATTTDGQQFARSYQATAAMLIAELRDLQRPLVPAAASVPDGTPHPEPLLARRVGKPAAGMYVRDLQPDPEAG